MFIERTLCRPWRQASRDFPVLLLTGPRQTGKTTLLKHLKNKNRSYISLDNLDTRIAARQDPATFIQNLKLPVKDQNEVDLLMERSGKIHPIEIKKSASLKNMHFKGLNIVQKHPTTDTGCVLCFHSMVLPLRQKVYSCPISYI